MLNKLMSFLNRYIRQPIYNAITLLANKSEKARDWVGCQLCSLTILEFCVVILITTIIVSLAVAKLPIWVSALSGVLLMAFYPTTAVLVAVEENINAPEGTTC